MSNNIHESKKLNDRDNFISIHDNQKSPTKVRPSISDNSNKNSNIMNNVNINQKNSINFNVSVGSSHNNHITHSISKSDEKSKNENFYLRDYSKEQKNMSKDGLSDESDEELSLEKINKKNIFLTKDNENKASNIINEINGLKLKINDIIKNQHWKYMTSFESFMEEIRDELLEKVNKLKQQERDKRKNENLHLMTCERDFYKQEAVRLNMICKQLNENYEKTLKEKRTLVLDIKNMNEKWKESEKINKHLLLELECKIQENIELEKENNMYKQEVGSFSNSNDNNNNNNYNINNANNNNIIVNINNGFENKTNSNFFPKLSNTQYSKISKFSNNQIKAKTSNTNYNESKSRKNKWVSENIDTSNSPNKEELKQELQRTNYRETSLENLNKQNVKLVNEKNKYLTCLKTISKNKYEKNRLENILNDCIESVRNDIIKRKENSGYTKHEIKKGLKLDEKLDKEINDIKNTRCNKEDAKFLIKDKYTLLEKFILDEEVLTKLRDVIFNEKKMMETNGFTAFRNTNYTNNSDENIKNQTTSNFGNSFNNTAINFNNNEKSNFNPNATNLNKFHNLTKTDKFDFSKFNKFNRDKNSQNNTANEFFRKFKSANKTFYNKKNLRLEKMMPLFPF